MGSNGPRADGNLVVSILQVVLATAFSAPAPPAAPNLIILSANDGWETGIKFKPVRWLDGRVAYWEQVASDEVRRKLNEPALDEPWADEHWMTLNYQNADRAGQPAEVIDDADLSE